MTHIIKQAFKELYPERQFTYIPKLKHSAKFKGYNANINLRGNELTVKLSKGWLGVSNEIKKGLIQELLVRLLKKRAHTINIDLYNHFLRSISKSAPKTKSNPTLANSFNRVNDRYFYGILEQPNLVLGSGTTKLGHYDFGTDTILISSILLDNQLLLDYVMYHEMLHKKHQFTSSEGRHSFHNREFRVDEKKFENSQELDKELVKLVRKAKKSFWNLF